MKRFIRALTVVISLVLSAVLLSAYTGKSEHIGLYKCEYLRSEGESFSAESIFPGGASLELDNGGKAVLNINAEEYLGQWSVSGGKLELTLDATPDTYRGTIAEGVCIISLTDDGSEYVFVREGVAAPGDSGLTVPDETENELQRAWNGGWYGMWTISNADGEWRTLDRQSYDLFARIFVDEDGSGTMTLWDEELSEDEPMGVLDIAATLGDDDRSRSVSVTGGTLWLSAIEAGDVDMRYISGWLNIMPEVDDVENATESEPFGNPDAGEGDTLYVAQGQYSAEEGSFDYTLILRPWGAAWSDAELNYPHLLPYHYYDWYLPAIEVGESFPSRLDGIVFNAADAQAQQSEKE